MEKWREDVLIHYGVKGMKWGSHLRSVLENIRDPYGQKRLERYGRAYESAARRRARVAKDETAYQKLNNNFSNNDRRRKLVRDAENREWLKKLAKAENARAAAKQLQNATDNAKRNLGGAITYSKYLTQKKGGTYKTGNVVIKTNGSGMTTQTIYGPTTTKSLYDTADARRQRVKKANDAYKRKESVKNATKKAKKTVKSVLSKFGIN